MLQALDAAHFHYEFYNLQCETFLFLALFEILISVKSITIMDL